MLILESSDLFYHLAVSAFHSGSAENNEFLDGSLMPRNFSYFCVLTILLCRLCCAFSLTTLFFFKRAIKLQD